ncbi:HET-domain-containing protein [Lindgomyces ingoldianus]|uniref:HET-domain-containing protein n=1 Tax=Lindgomyces ingoldianus TaxID=673940 RepID=A0ACB6QJP2_9PLEO|nr:HET-domain-containing protein [Lindgomyces ingoldianus]KAF2467224.1 HET-domain-containing protein [Lindgomyces ingoldianus]
MDSTEQSTSYTSGSTPYPDHSKQIAEYVATGRIRPLASDLLDEDPSGPPSPRTYAYTKLPHNDSIRIFVLQPGKSYEPLTCSLILARLSNMPYVEAISYTWGNSERLFTVSCDNRDIRITRNLRNALRQVRHENVTRLLWADSICINQEDLEELGQQVAMMGDVFGSAKRVLICVGADSEFHAPAVQALVGDVNAMMDRSFANMDLENDKFPWILKDNDLLKDPRWSSLKELLSVPWFHRGWVIQEALLAATATVKWGETEISWELLGRTQRWLLRRGQSAATTHDIHLTHLLWNDFNHRRPTEAGTMEDSELYYNYTLLEVMNSARRLSMMDLRDRVYAFLGLHRTTSIDMLEYMRISKDRPVLDYTISHLQVYHKFASGYLSKSSDLKLFMFIQHDDESLAAGIPSWAPRWDLHECKHPIGDSTWPLLQSADGSGPKVEVRSEDEVQVRGVIVDRVVLTSEPHPGDGISLDMALSTLGLFWSSARSHVSPYKLSDRGKHLARTLRCGRFRGHRETWDQHESAYIRLLLGYSEVAHEERGYGIDVEALSGHGDAEFANVAFRSRLVGRRVFLTERGYFGLTGNVVRKGDLVGIVFGTATPFLFRKCNDKYQILGDAYVESKTGGLLGREDEDSFLGSKDWVHWDVEEQDLILI